MLKEYQEGINAGYQPYWVLYCLAHKKPLDHSRENNIEFMTWINREHNEFDPFSYNRITDSYMVRFIIHMLDKIDRESKKGTT